jgi:hypothetical protein
MCCKYGKRQDITIRNINLWGIECYTLSYKKRIIGLSTIFHIFTLIPSHQISVAHGSCSSTIQVLTDSQLFYLGKTVVAGR